jgi:hypothetical protein
LKKILAGIMATMFFVMVMFMGAMAPASATGGNIPSPENNKKVTLCHATGSESNPYTKITVSVNAFYTAGHIDHEGDIYNGFTWTDNKGNAHVVPSKGNTALLAFDDCVQPRVDVPVVKPDVTYVDLCGTSGDVFSVPTNPGYTVTGPVNEGSNMVITVALNDGFKWADNSTDDLRFVKPAFTNVDCDLPETGGKQTFAAGGLTGMAMIALSGGAYVLAGRRKVTA